LRRYPKEVFGVNWDSISFGLGDQPIKRIMMSEPLKGTKKHVEQLFADSPTAKDLIENLKA
jgi:proteasome accessory factor A